jgi:hypothetical protein
MSLLEQAYEDYTMLNKVTVDDGYGGYNTAWQDGATIKGAMVFNTSIEGRKAEAMGVSSVYTLTTKKDVVLEYHDVLRRERDGKIFRVTSDGDDSYTPASARLDMRQVTCEEWVLPKEV